jgi:hypothetical protein
MPTERAVSGVIFAERGQLGSTGRTACQGQLAWPAYWHTANDVPTKLTPKQEACAEPRSNHCGFA